MAKNSPCFLTVVIALFLLPLFISLANCSYVLPREGWLYEEKTRLGSTPPSCHNKCNLCHPCEAVQVPTLPSHRRDSPREGRQFLPTGFSDSSSGSNRYSNYKPLGWKCRCNGQLYNP